MKKIAVGLLILNFSFGFSQVKWMTLADALAAQKTTPKKIMIDFYADWCSSCETMEKYTYNQAEITDLLNENYYAVKFNSESDEIVQLFGRKFINSEYKTGQTKNSLHEFTKYMNVTTVPTTVFLDEKGKPITMLQGALTAKELEPYVTFIVTDEFKKIKTKEEWQNYQKKFKSIIKN